MKERKQGGRQEGNRKEVGRKTGQKYINTVSPKHVSSFCDPLYIYLIYIYIYYFLNNILILVYGITFDQRVRTLGKQRHRPRHKTQDALSVTPFRLPVFQPLRSYSILDIPILPQGTRKQWRFGGQSKTLQDTVSSHGNWYPDQYMERSMVSLPPSGSQSVLNHWTSGPTWEDCVPLGHYTHSTLSQNKERGWKIRISL